MYNEQLENLINLALADGELTEKEKQILFKKAEAAGIDLDEFEMVLDAKLAERKKVAQPSPTPVASAPKSDKFGDIRKCPACGSMLQSFQTKCDDCGHEFSNVQAVGSAQKLFDLLQAAALRNSEKISEQDRDKSRRLEALSQKHNSDSGLVKILAGKSRAASQEEEREDLIRECDDSRRKIESSLALEKANIIKNFPVPNTKEDLLELLAMSTSNAYDNDGVVGPEEEVWIQKCDQIYTKVKAVATNDKQLLENATNMIVALMRKLPGKYKKFTQIPENMREKFEAENNREKERLNEKRIALAKKYGVFAGISALMMILGNFDSLSTLLPLGFLGLSFTIYKFWGAFKNLNNSEF
jgi:hypothetical protein